MRYVFKDKETLSELPIKDFQIVWFNEKWRGFDESFIESDKFSIHDLAYIETEEEIQNNLDHSKVFVNMKNGDSYELVLKKVSGQRST